MTALALAVAGFALVPYSFGWFLIGIGVAVLYRNWYRS